MESKIVKIESSKKICDLKMIVPRVFYDFRGEYIETFNETRYEFHDRNGKRILFVQDDVSVSRRDVLRGLHGDSKTWKLIQCLWGDIYVVVVDMRQDSSTYLSWEAFTINDKNRMQILVPAGCANGHLCLSDRCVFSYKQSHYYEGSNRQFTVRWNDPKLGIYWPIRNPILSDRDNSASFVK